MVSAYLQMQSFEYIGILTTLKSKYSSLFWKHLREMRIKQEVHISRFISEELSHNMIILIYFSLLPWNIVTEKQLPKG